MRESRSAGAIWFVVSVCTLSFLYGVAVGVWKWPPYAFLDTAAKQGRTLYRTWTAGAIPDRFMGPRAYDWHGVRRPAPEQVQPGLTLYASYWTWGASTPAGPGAKLIDRRGRTIHEWRVDPEALFPDSVARRAAPSRAELHGTYLFPNGDLLVNLEYVGTARLDACGRVRWTLAEKNHHSIARADDGSFWIPGVSAERRTRSARYPDGYPGIEQPVWLDQILHVSEQGTVLDRIPVLDVLYANGLERYLVKGQGPYIDRIPADPTHLNDVEPLDSARAASYPQFEAGDLLVSLRHPSLVFVFDPETKAVKWHASEPFLHQHDPDFLGKGRIGVFDNNEDPTRRGTMLGGSRIVVLRPPADPTTIWFPTPTSDPFYTATAGSWQWLDNGNLLLTEARFGRIVEAAPDGTTVWEWVRPPYDASRIPFVTGGTRYDLTRAEVASWPCSSVDSGSLPDRGEKP